MSVMLVWLPPQSYPVTLTSLGRRFLAKIYPSQGRELVCKESGAALFGHFGS